jgi:hypothetical protein
MGMTLLILLFIAVIGPLAVYYGVDSRIDEHRR